MVFSIILDNLPGRAYQYPIQMIGKNFTQMGMLKLAFSMVSTLFRMAIIEFLWPEHLGCNSLTRM